MASRIIISNVQYFNELRNGQLFDQNTGDFTNFLLSNIGGKMKFSCDISINNTLQLGRFDITGGNTITSISGASFLDEDFYEGGQAVIVYTDGANPPISNAFTIVSITSDGSTMICDDGMGGSPGLTDGSYGLNGEIGWLRDLSPSEGCYMKFNFIGNKEQENYISKIDQVEQVFKFDNLVAGVGVPVAGVWGNVVRGSKSGEAIMTFTGTQLDNGVNMPDSDPPFNGFLPLNTIQNYTLEQEFIVNPVWLQGELNNIANQIRPDRLNGSDLRHIIDFDFRSALSNPNTAKKAQYNNVLGTMNYFGEVYIDEENTYTVTGVSLQDAGTLQSVQGIITNETTRVTFTVNDSGGTFAAGNPVVVAHQALFTSDKYAGSKDEYQETNLYETLRIEINDVPQNGTIITNLTATLVSPNEITVQYDLVYTFAQQTRIDTGDNFGLWVEVGNTQDTEFSNKSPLTVATGEYLANTDVPGLFETTITFVDHVLNEFTDYEGAIEDLVLVRGQIKTDHTLQANIDNISIQLIGVNPADLEDFFDITRLQIPIESTIVNGRQIITLISSRGFNIPSDGGVEIFNNFSLNWVMDDGQFSYYDFEIGYHLSWQDWEAITGVPDAFFDLNEPNNGLNKNSSRYSNKQGYETSISILANMSQRNVEDNQTLYHTISPRLDIYNKEENVLNI